jgi:AcrR family transcriptional regulator
MIPYAPEEELTTSAPDPARSRAAEVMTTGSLKDALVEHSLESARARVQEEVDQLLHAARSILARNGWQDFKMNSVLREANVSTRSFYRDFNGKAGLLLLLFEEDVSQFAKRLTKALEPAQTAPARLKVWITLNVEVGYTERTAGRARMFARAGEALVGIYPEEVWRIRRLIIDPLEQILADGKQTNEFPYARPADDAITIWLLTSALIRSPLGTERDPAELDRAIQLVLDFSERALSRL